MKKTVTHQELRSIYNKALTAFCAADYNGAINICAKNLDVIDIGNSRFMCKTFSRLYLLKVLSRLEQDNSQVNAKQNNIDSFVAMQLAAKTTITRKYAKATCYYINGEYKRALRLYKKALLRKPRHALLLYLCGRCCQELKREGDANSCFKNAVANRSDFRAAREALQELQNEDVAVHHQVAVSAECSSAQGPLQQADPEILVDSNEVKGDAQNPTHDYQAYYNLFNERLLMFCPANFSDSNIPDAHICSDASLDLAANKSHAPNLAVDNNDDRKKPDGAVLGKYLSSLISQSKWDSLANDRPLIIADGYTKIDLHNHNSFAALVRKYFSNRGVMISDAVANILNQCDNLPVIEKLNIIISWISCDDSDLSPIKFDLLALKAEYLYQLLPPTRQLPPKIEELGEDYLKYSWNSELDPRLLLDVISPNTIIEMHDACSRYYYAVCKKDLSATQEVLDNYRFLDQAIRTEKVIDVDESLKIDVYMRIRALDDMVRQYNMIMVSDCDKFNLCSSGQVAKEYPIWFAVEHALLSEKRGRGRQRAASHYALSHETASDDQASKFVNADL